MPGTGPIYLELAAESDDVADRLAGELFDELAAELARTRTDVTTERVKGEAGTQDMGAILAVVLGSGAAIELAKALHAWLARRNQVRLTVKTAAGEVVASGVESHDVPAIIAALNRAGAK
jgi:hypothetical protein